MPSKQAKSNKFLKKKKAAWCKKYGHTAKAIAKYRKKHGKDSVPAPPS